MGRAQPQPSLVKSPSSLLPLCICGVQARQAAKASTYSLVKSLEAVKLGSRRRAPHAVDQSEMAATGAKQAEADLRVIQATDGIEELGRRCCPL